MKKSFITTVLLGVMISSQAQLTHFFPDSNSYFSVSWMKFWFQGDTTIGDYTYKKVYMQNGDSIADFNRASYFAAIREDTIAEKVYCVNPTYGVPYTDARDEREVLLYDFSLNVGEKVNFYSFWSSWGSQGWGSGSPYIKEQVVISIDSILIDNHYRKRINFHNEHSGIEYWIEGIGSTHGIFFSGNFDIADAMDWTRLLCVHIDGRIIYPSSDYSNSCYRKEYTNISEKKNEIFKIYPTVADNLLYVGTEKNIENFDYKIINTQGQIINSGMLKSNTVNVETLSKGFYFIVISDKKQNSKKQKFIKH